MKENVTLKDTNLISPSCSLNLDIEDKRLYSPTDVQFFGKNYATSQVEDAFSYDFEFKEEEQEITQDRCDT